MISSFAFAGGPWIGRSSSWWACLVLLYWLLFTTLIMFNITVVESEPPVILLVTLVVLTLHSSRGCIIGIASPRVGGGRFIIGRRRGRR